MATEAQGQGQGATQTLEGGSLLDEILAETKMTPGDEGYEIAKRGVQAFNGANGIRQTKPSSIPVAEVVRLPILTPKRNSHEFRY